MMVKWEFLEDGTMKVKSPVWEEEQILPKYIAKVFQTREMIRTKDINQTGYSYIDIPGLKENSRWNHQIMVVQLELPFLQKAKDILEESGIEVDEEELEIAEMVFASHDVGHTDNSHHSEQILKYLHEQRTTDILLGDTELGRLLSSRYPKDKIENVVNIITKEGNVPKEELSPLMQLYAQLVSSGGDLDKFAYTLGDTTCAGIKSSLDPKKYLESLGVEIDTDGNYILHWSEEGQRQLEILDIERFQNYRDIYYNVSDEIMVKMEPVMLKLVEQESDEIKEQLPEPFLNKIRANNSDIHITTLEEELEMTNPPMEEAWNILSKKAKNQVLRYLSDIQGSRKDYYCFETKREFSEILAQLQEIFPDKDISKINSLFEMTSKCKMIKQGEEPWIKSKNGDLQMASEKEGCLIRAENFIRRRVFFNPELLRLELNLTKEQFSEYQTEIEWLLDDLLQREEEFQQKYILKDRGLTIEDFINFMEEQGFIFEGKKVEKNEDDYLENRDLQLLKTGKEFRIREKTTSNKKIKRYIDYKEQIAQGKFSHRRSIKKAIKGETSIEEAKKSVEEKTGEELNLENSPFMHVSTNRTKLMFRKKEKRFYVSWDESTYNNKWLNQTAEDIMLEIAPVGEDSDRLILKSIQQMLNRQTKQLEEYNGSKVSRGAYLTYKKKKELDQRKETVEQERELKCQFDNNHREELIKIVKETLAFYGITPEGEEKVKLQVDEYFDTPTYELAHKGSSLRIRETKDAIEGTYKTKANGDKGVMFNRNEMNIILQEKSTNALIEGASMQYGVSIPEDIIPVVRVKNERTKQNYTSDDVLMELAFDKVENTDLSTGIIQEAKLGEFELEFKEQINSEKAEEIIKNIWLDLLRKCTQRDIMIVKSKYSKYVSALISLGIIEDIDRENIK